MNNQPKQKEIWLFDPDPVIGNELGKKKRPALIISNNLINQGPSNLIIIVPCTSKEKGIPSHVHINPPNGGVKSATYAVCEQLRTISRVRLIHKIGVVDPFTMRTVLEWINDFIRLDKQ